MHHLVALLAIALAPLGILAPRALSGPQVGAAAPDFSLTTITGKHVSLASYRGKTLVINVWATWCPPCRQEMPELITTARALQKDGVAVLGVDTTEEAPIVRAYVAAKNVSYPQALDPAKSFSHAYDVQYFPTTYVVDRSGVLRARYIDVIAAPQLRALVAAADAGRNGVIASPLQSKIDASLAPDLFAFAGDPSTIEAAALAASKAIAGAETMLDQSDAAAGNATDLLRTRAEEAALRDRAIAALEASTAKPQDASLLALLRGDAARDRESWREAIDDYQQTLAIAPQSDEALAGLALAAARIKEYGTVVDADAKLVELAPTDAGALIELARAQALAGSASDAYATFERALSVAQTTLATTPTAKALRMLAFVHLYYGRTYAKAGDTRRARLQFDQLLKLASQLPATDERHDMYLEEGQEALVALRLGEASGAAAISLAPWTGADLPGSIPHTIKFRLVVAGNAGKTVALTATNVPKHWIASFCSDRVCSPFRTRVAIPDSGVKIVEFQLVPPSAADVVPKVRVTGTSDGVASFATT